jgi:hypothetical protein
VQKTDKKVVRVDFGEDGDETTLFNAQQMFVHMQTCLVSGKEAVVGLTTNLRLYLNDKLFSNECTSFLLSQNFFTFINSTSGLSHELFLYDLNKPLPQPTFSFEQTNQAPKLASLDDKGNFNVRAVERGARLVMIYGFKAVVQMPRGNLEGIQPIIIMLKAIF